MENVLEILKHLPKGTKVYYTVLGCDCKFELLADKNNVLPIKLLNRDFDLLNAFGQGRLNAPFAECLIFPSKDHRTWSDWRKFYGIPKQPQFKPNDPVLVRSLKDRKWELSHYGYFDKEENLHCCINGAAWFYCLPYEGNEKLLGTTDNP